MWFTTCSWYIEIKLKLLKLVKLVKLKFIWSLIKFPVQSFSVRAEEAISFQYPILRTNHEKHINNTNYISYNSTRQITWDATIHLKQDNRTLREGPEGRHNQRDKPRYLTDPSHDFLLALKDSGFMRCHNHDNQWSTIRHNMAAPWMFHESLLTRAFWSSLRTNKQTQTNPNTTWIN